MTILEVRIADIGPIQIVRQSVTENILSDPSLVTDQDCEEFITKRGKGWVCEVEGRIVGFAIVDPKEHYVWALFVHPEYAKKGIRLLLNRNMLDWYFTQTTETVWLGTAFNTRAEQFYRRAGWTEVGTHSEQEIKFEMKYTDWVQASRR